MKRCCHCRETKPLDQFKRNRTVPDGYHRECKACCKARREQGDTRARENAQRRARYLANRDAELAYAAEYRKTDKWRAIWQARNAARCGRFSDNPQPWELQQRAWQIAYQTEHRDRLRANNRRWTAANRERYNAYARRKHAEYRAADPERFRKISAEQSRKYRANNPQHKAVEYAYTRRWRAANPEKATAHNHIRRIRRLGGGETFSGDEWAALKASFSHCCLCCGKVEPAIKLTADHVIPLSRGGSNAIHNIQPLCGPCNSSKGTSLTDYRISHSPPPVRDARSAPP